MADYTPTTAEIRRALLSVASPTTEEFDRWLVAHDAEVRASVVTEEPEWEIGYQLTQDDGVSIGTGYPYPDAEHAAFDGERRAKETNEDQPMYPRVRSVIVRRRKAGPWVPVEQGDET